VTLHHHYIITCEHASNKVPAEWAHLFKGSKDALDSHYGWDPGAIELAVRIAEKLGAKLHAYPWSRLLIEPNRSKGHTALFSNFTKSLPIGQKIALMEKYYMPYRKKVRDEIEKATASGKQVIHISAHTFTPAWEGEVRDLDIGLLYDPRRKTEKEFCRSWKKILAGHLPELRARMNRPYRGIADGHTASLRQEFGGEDYLGIEIEVNQKHWFKSRQVWNSICENIADSLSSINKT